MYGSHDVSVKGEDVESDRTKELPDRPVCGICMVSEGLQYWAPYPAPSLTHLSLLYSYI